MKRRLASVVVPLTCLLLVGSVTALVAQAGAVETAMRRVDFHVDSTVILHIEYLRGRLVARRPNLPASFDDKLSFDIEMDTAAIGVTMTSLGELLNRYVFNYDGSPLRALTTSTEGGRLKQSGRLHGLPFSIVCDVSVTATAELRLHPVSIKVFGIGATGLMKTFGLSLQKLANVKKATGVRIEGNDLLLAPALMLPPPLIRGKLTAAAVRDSAITLQFGRHAGTTALAIPDSRVTNYMYFRGSTIRFGRLTMTPADLLVVDHDARDPFDFWLTHYQAQLVAGVSRTTLSGGLITEWPDYNKISAKK